MSRNPEEYDDDNGMTIVDMNVEGTAWYNQYLNKTGAKKSPTQQLTRSESRLYTYYSLLAGLLVALVFSATWILFTLFATNVWLK